jgi:hypothetical protein
MNIIIDTQITPEIREKYLLLELDTFRVSDHDTHRAWCLVEPQDPDDMVQVLQFVDLHSNLMPSYRQRYWDYVEEAIGHLQGRWNHQLDSFYSDLLARVQHLRHSDIDPDWDGIIDRRPLHAQNLPGSDQQT